MNTCATCRFRAEPRDDWFGTSARSDGAEPLLASCTRIIHGNYQPDDVLDRELAVVVDGSGYAARLKVMPKFGCVLHEPKSNA